MKKVITFVTVGIFLAVSSGVALADGPELSVGASASYVYDVNSSGGGNSSLYANQESRDESFNIDLVQLGVSGATGDVTYGAKIDLGDLTALAGDSSDGDIALQEAWISYDAGSVDVTGGRVGTPIGIEVLEPWGNPHISRSNGWQLQPINHDGVTVSGSGGGLDVMIGVVNGFTVSDVSANDGDDEKGIIASVAGVAGDIDLSVTGLFTEEGDILDQTVLNAIASAAVADMDAAVEFTYREDDPDASSSKEAFNVALYVGSELGNTGVAARLEYSDDEGINTSLDTEVWSITVTAGWELAENVDFRVEYRHDDADDAIFADGSSTDDAADVIQAQVVFTN